MIYVYSYQGMLLGYRAVACALAAQDFVSLTYDCHIPTFAIDAAPFGFQLRLLGSDRFVSFTVSCPYLVGAEIVS